MDSKVAENHRHQRQCSFIADPPVTQLHHDWTTLGSVFVDTWADESVGQSILSMAAHGAFRRGFSTAAECPLVRVPNRTLRGLRPTRQQGPLKVEGHIIPKLSQELRR